MRQKRGWILITLNKEDVMATAAKNRAGAIFVRAMWRIDRLHKEIDRRAKNGKYNENYAPKFKFAENGARVWSF